MPWRFAKFKIEVPDSVKSPIELPGLPIEPDVPTWNIPPFRVKFPFPDKALFKITLPVVGALSPAVSVLNKSNV